MEVSIIAGCPQGESCLHNALIIETIIHTGEQVVLNTGNKLQRMELNRHH